MSEIYKTFKQQNPFEKRKEMAQNYLAKYNGRLPFIVEPGRYKKYHKYPKIQKIKMLLEEKDQCISIIRSIKQKLQLKKTNQQFESSIQLLCNNIILNPMQVIKEVYHEKKDQDGFVYIQYVGQKVFGNNDYLTFKEMYSQQYRTEKCKESMRKYPLYIPLIIEPKKQNKSLKNRRYLVKSFYTCPNIIRLVKDNLINNKQQSDRLVVNLFCKKNQLKPEQQIQKLYLQQKDNDGFLYIQYASLETFGGIKTQQNLMTL